MNHAELLRSFFQHLVESDPQIQEKLGQLEELRHEEGVRAALEGLSDLEGVESPGDVAIETIVSRVGRPVLEVQGNEYVLAGPEIDIWRERLDSDAARSTIRRIIPAVGRIEVENHPMGMDWLGTGALVADDIVITNRHVANEFATRSGERFTFQIGGDGRRMTAKIDFHEERRATTPAEFSVLDILYIEDAPGPDMAFLKINPRGTSGRLATPLRLARRAPSSRDYVATVGYPAEDSRIPDQALVLRIFGDVYNVKRMAPGQVQRSDRELVTHDCSTLGGNSGSPLFRLDTGEMVGLHFAGLFLRENRSVPVAIIHDRLQRLGGSRPRPSDGTRDRDRRRPERHEREEPSIAQPQSADQQESTWTIPIHISVKLGQPTLTVGNITKDVSARPSAAHGVDQMRNRLASSPDVLAVREGYLFRNGWITKEKVVVVLVKGREARESAASSIPSQVDGVPVQIRVAGPWDYLEAQAALELLEGVPQTAYKKPRDFKLSMVNEEMSVTCHVSPDAGWPTLEDFLADTKKSLTIGMYDFTAPHIIAAIEDAVDDDSRKLLMVLQAKESLSKKGTKAKDRPEEETVKKYKRSLKERFRFTWASIGKGRQFATAYHIKVIVQDGKAFWASSGNLQSSNQPNEIDTRSWDALLTFNREWHVVVRSPALAKQYEQFIRYDYRNARKDAAEEAPLPPELLFFVEEEPALEARRPPGKPRYFRPKTVERKIRVMPLLTPDNYQQEVFKLIETAEEQVLFQNQSLSLLSEDKNDERFTALADALLSKQEAGLDVRIIMRGEFDVSRPLEMLQERGFDMDRVRLQDRCHTKGIIVDGEKVCIGSHNWTNQGTLVNRDASLIFHDREIADYYRDIFEFDWKNLTRQSVDEAREVVLADTAHEAPSNMVAMSWEEILLD